MGLMLVVKECQFLDHKNEQQRANITNLKATLMARGCRDGLFITA